MISSDEDTSWLDADETPVIARSTDVKAAKSRRKKSKKKAAARKAERVDASSKIDHAGIRGRVMFGAVNGRKRIWACDGQYVFFRRKSCVGADGNTDGTGRKHVAIERHDAAIERGDFTYIETQDDVEICRVNPQSPFFREGLYLGQLDENMLQRQVVLAACKHDWPLYVDALEELAGRIKGKWQTAGQAATVWSERLTYIEHLIALRGGPARAHISAALQRVRIQRGESKGRVLVMPPRTLPALHAGI